MIQVVLGLVLLGFAVVSMLMGNPVLVALHLIPSLSLLGFAGLARRVELRERLWGESGRRGAWFGGNLLIQTLSLGVLLSGLAYAAHRYPLRWDLTEAGVYTLSPGSLRVIEQMPEGLEIEIVAFFAGRAPVREFLDLYAFANDRIRYRVVDANRDPLLARQLEVEQDQTLVVCPTECASAAQRIQVTAANEGKLTRAIRRIIAEPRRVLFVSGHDEAALERTDAAGLSGLSELLLQENIEAEPFLLANATEIPESADALVIASPSFSFFERETALLVRYVEAGGRLLLLVDPLQSVKLDPVLDALGVRLGSDIIVDRRLDGPGAATFGVQPIVSEYAKHPITEVLQGRPTIFNLARSVELTPEAKGEGTVLFRTSSQSLAAPEAALGPNGLDLKDGRDRPGPHGLAVALELEPEQAGARPGRVVVVGDADFVRNRSVVEGSNADLFLNMVNWLVGDEGFIAIERKRPRASRVEFTRWEYRTLSYFVILFVPESILFLGVLNWWRRRRV